MNNWHFIEECMCHRCGEVRTKRAMVANDYSAMMAEFYMRLCPICGNKRCPKATDHSLECTGSNDSGQPGSIYE